MAAPTSGNPSSRWQAISRMSLKSISPYEVFTVS